MVCVGLNSAKSSAWRKLCLWCWLYACGCGSGCEKKESSASGLVAKSGTLKVALSLGGCECVGFKGMEERWVSLMGGRCGLE